MADISLAKVFRRGLSGLDIRAIVLEQMRRWGMNRHSLAERSGLATRTVYDYLDGKSEMTADKLGRLLAVLELEIRPKGTAGTARGAVPASPKRRK